MAHFNLIGQRFGKLQVTWFAGTGRRGATLWSCRCDCGGNKVVSTGCLRSGGVRSCGCAHKEWAAASGPNRRAVLTDRRFGKWTVIEAAGVDVRQRFVWRCRCECGTVRIVNGSHLIGGRSTNCGCVRIEKAVSRLTTHGKSHTAEFGIWQTMQNRCYYEKHIGFANYGKRGITVCDRWRESFENFYADMGPRPSPELSIERKDNDGNYEPGNCKWATRLEQAQNTRRKKAA